MLPLEVLTRTRLLCTLSGTAPNPY